MEVLENLMGRVDYFDDDRIIQLSLIGDVSGLELRQLFVGGLECMKEHFLTNWITDFSSKAPFSAEDRHWLHWTWFPAMQTQGWSHWAIVRPFNAVAAAGMVGFSSMARDVGVEVVEFDRITEARAWMRALAKEQAF